MTERTMKGVEDVPRLVREIQAGDKEAFMILTRMYQQKVFLLAYSFFQNRDDALDIVQETFLRCYQKIRLYRKGSNFQSWLLQIAKNLCIDQYRKQARREGNPQEAGDHMDIPLYTKDSLKNSSDLKPLISRGLKMLSEKQRLVFVMKHYNGLKYQEIAETLNIALGTVKSHHFKAVRNLRTILSPQLGRTG